MSAPFYLLIANDLKDKINSGMLNPGDMIPSEHEICREYNTSRTTVRKSLSLLENEGYIFPVAGKGCFVRKPELHNYMFTFNEMDMVENNKDNIKLLGVNIINPTKELMFHLQIARDTKLVKVNRLFYSNEQPVAYDIKYLLYDRGKPIVEQEIQYATFPEIVAKKASPFTMKKQLKIRSEAAATPISQELSVEAGFPLVVIEQKFLNEKEKPIGWGRIYFNSERFELTALSVSNSKER
ncbi:MAG: GntR family transcriptional regulator [Thermincola sp.]|nr:GntR family transcriptional regulator [Thermincola sp.]MDT3703415.1 GntR family transcriptional regulator [Thermincola sp.]